MRKLLTPLLVAGMSCCLMLNPANGQLVQITPNGFGGVNIRAPFVRINTNPYGPTHVRAPFVDVNAPPRYYQPQPYYGQPYQNGNYPPAYGTPVYGTPATISPSEVAPSYPAGDPRLEPGTALAPTTARQPIKSTDREPTRNELPAPDGMKSVLETIPNLASDLPAARQNLIASSHELHQSLSQYANATVWQDFLKLPEFVADESSWKTTNAIDQDQLNQLLKLLSRFEKTNGKQEMHLINNLEAFRSTHAELSNFVQLVQDQVQQDTSDLPPAPRETPDN